MLNRPKSYKLLIISLFILFISLVSRSLIYMGISITVAAAIIFLLTKDMKEKREHHGSSNENRLSEKEEKRRATAGKFSSFGLIVMLLGASMIFYGGVGLFTQDHFLYQTGIMSEQPFVLYTFFILGAVLLFYGVYQIIFQYLYE